VAVLGGAMPGAPSSEIRLCGAEPPLEFVVVTVEPTSTVTVLPPSHPDYYLAEWCFRFNRRRSGHRGLLSYNVVEQAAQTEPKPYTEVLSPKVGRRRRRRQKADRERRAEGILKPARNVPRTAPKRPGGQQDRAQRRSAAPAPHARQAAPRSQQAHRMTREMTAATEVRCSRDRYSESDTP
jgi:hypothetical protein